MTASPAATAPFETAETSLFLQEAVAGLEQPQKSLPSKYFYDARGAELFEQICELPEYYPTRTELGILESYSSAIAQQIGSNVRVVEYGAGAGIKTQLLLSAVEQPTAYIPVDISAEQLEQTAKRLAQQFPALEVLPLAADYSTQLQLPQPSRSFTKTVVFFPGSTIGNFSHAEAKRFLQRLAPLVSDGGGVLIGVDLKKPTEVLEAAYNDAAGVTAQFNMNLLTRMNRELNANFQIDQFYHCAFYNEDSGAIEMHLVSRSDQQVQLDDRELRFTRGETIHTENSHKYTLDEFAALAAEAGLVRQQAWLDSEELFSLQYFTVA